MKVKNNITIAMLMVSGLVMNFASLYGAAPVKVGIKPYEIESARKLANDRGDSSLYRLLGGEGRIQNKRSGYLQKEIDYILWPVLVWAIEEGNKDLTVELLAKISPTTKKPYGRALTPLEIAEYHNQGDILKYMQGYILSLKRHMSAPLE